MNQSALEHLAAFGEQAIPRPRQHELARIERIRSKPLTEAELEEQRRRKEKATLRAGYHRFRREAERALRTGPHDDEVREVRRLLARLRLDRGGAELVAFVASSTLASLDPASRYTLLAMIDRRLIAVRERAGLPPFDDSIWGEPRTLFQVIRKLLS